jgi:hypothetical protein
MPSGHAPEDPFARIRKRYLRFADIEARGSSPLYERLARATAAHEPALRFLSTLPDDKQRPNLLFAAVRHLFGTPPEESWFLSTLQEHPDRVRSLMLARRVQTNEPGRCATLLPALVRLPQPLALIEVGAAAGLCLLPDRYAYRYQTPEGEPRAELGGRNAPRFTCTADDATPIPDDLPEIVWRAGLDLHPIDLGDPDEVAWLETLVWPEHQDRLTRLRAAISVARRDPPPIHTGDLLDRLDEVAGRAPDGATLVVLNSAVLSHLPTREGVRRFRAHLAQMPVTWISNESPLVFPHHRHTIGHHRKDRFLLCVNDRPVALTGPHGGSIEWIES